jgi:glutamate dehydrogenase/leucine dehydrogenase
VTSLIDLSPQAFADRLRDEGGRACIVHDAATDGPRASAPWLDEVAAFLRDDERDHHAHEGLFFETGRETGTLYAAFVHWTSRGQSAGGVRYWPYVRTEDLLRDGLRLSVGMTRKNALAGLWWGGGKGIIARQPDERWRDPEFRRVLFREYGEFITSLRGCYVTAEDAGTTPPDMAEVFTRTRFITCIPPGMGGSGNPSGPTAHGVVCAMEGALDHLGLGSLEGKTVAMQGAGNVAGFMIGHLLERGAGRIVAAEISGERLAEVRETYPDPRLELREVAIGDLSIFDEPCDVFAPNALGGSLNPDTIPRLKAKVVCGAANNQLLDDRRDDRALAERGIVYVPDFLCNRMGIVNCANEQYGRVPDDPAIQRHFGRDWDNAVYVITQRILERSAQEETTTSTAANLLADELARQDHPIWPDRGRQIIAGLVADGWQARDPR